MSVALHNVRENTVPYSPTKSVSHANSYKKREDTFNMTLLMKAAENLKCRVTLLIVLLYYSDTMSSPEMRVTSYPSLEPCLK